jgi:hypothetical protein
LKGGTRIISALTPFLLYRSPAAILRSLSATLRKYAARDSSELSSIARHRW